MNKIWCSQRRVALLLLMSLGLISAAGCQTESGGYEVLCMAPERAPGMASSSAAEKMKVLSTYVAAEVKNAAVLETLDIMAVAPGAKKASILEYPARQAGYDGACPMATLLAGASNPAEAPASP